MAPYKGRMSVRRQCAAQAETDYWIFIVCDIKEKRVLCPALAYYFRTYLVK